MIANTSIHYTIHCASVNLGYIYFTVLGNVSMNMVMVKQAIYSITIAFCSSIPKYRIDGYIGGNDIWQIALKRKKIAIGGYNFGSYSTIATPSPGVWHNIGRFNIGSVTRNPPIHQI